MKALIKGVGGVFKIAPLLSAILLVLSLSAKEAAKKDIVTSGFRVLSIGRSSPVEKELELPLKHTSVSAEIAGFVSSVTVTQHFQNPHDEPIEAVYVFPLPQNGAVDDMTMIIGERRIKGVIKKREEALQIYEQAKSQDKTASLLEQERPNIFTQSVANILPGDDIKIEIHYFAPLKYDKGIYEFVFPMVVGPRYIPGSPIGASGGGFAPDTDFVPDASRITPVVMPPGTRSGHDIALTVKLDAGVPVKNIEVVSHKADINKLSDSRATVALHPSESIPNKDFILRYKVAGEKPEMALLTHAGEKGGFFILMIQPKANVEPREATPKEMVFVVDNSGSMSGDPIAKAKALVHKMLRGMNPDDTFQIIKFSERASGLSPVPLPNTPENVKEGHRFIDRMSGMGGTEMIEGIKASLDFPPDPKRMRIVFFLTDGYIGNDTQIIGEVEKRLGDARLFSFGVGTSVNRYLLERMAEVGRGEVQYARPDEDTKDKVEQFYERINNPYLTDIEIDWNGLSVEEVLPAKIPDLFSSQPLIVYGRYKRGGAADITLNGKIAGERFSQRLNVVLPERNEENLALAPIWAREKIKKLMMTMLRGENTETADEVTRLSLDFKLISQYTAFVAVEEKVRTEPGGVVKKVFVPVELPESVSYEGVFGGLPCEGSFTDVGGYGMGGGGYGPASPMSEPAKRSVGIMLRSAPGTSWEFLGGTGRGNYGYGSVSSTKSEDKSALREKRGGGDSFKAEIKAIKIAGWLSASEIKKDMNSRFAGVLKALSSELKAGKEIELRIKLVVKPEGGVLRAEISLSESVSVEAQRELQKIARGWTFRKSGEPSTTPATVELTLIVSSD
ncbi:MAG: hypothetical protein Kow0090_10340 [Myxococcota bacterium]